MPAPKEVHRLVEQFDPHSGLNETQVRREFIDPFFKALGWDVDNEKGHAQAYKDVIHEDAIKVGGISKAPDYSFRIGGTRKFFVEAKKPAIDLKEDTKPAYQVRRYAWSAKLPLSILTDFEEFVVYDCRKRPVLKDKASTGRIQYFKYTDYIEKWDEIAAIFSREAVLTGSFDKYVESNKGKRGADEVDNAFLKEIEDWRENLAKNIAIRNTSLTNSEINFAVQRTVDRIIFLRICEDRGIDEYQCLLGLINGPNIYGRLCELYQKADARYNSGLFHFQNERGRSGYPDELSLKLKIDDQVLKKIIRGLYYPECPYEFSVLPASILGQIYEQFLGKVIHLTKGHHAKIEDKPEVKKAGGVYYTPEYIVDYIVSNTLGKMLEGKTPKQVEKIKVLDPACGSGSFLIVAYQKLVDWHLDYYVKSKQAKHRKLIYQGPDADWRLATSEKKRILTNNIFGVDIDSQAVEVSKLSLLLKVLENETSETINSQLKLFHERALPDLSDNIKCGNSLIGPDFYDGQQMSLLGDEEIKRINVFDWNAEFSDIMQNGGFDVVVGNPPWGAALNNNAKEYLAAKYAGFGGNHDTYLFFIEKIVFLMNAEGCFSFITPDTWISTPQFSKIRRIVIENANLDFITILPTNVFNKVSANTIVFKLKRGMGNKKCSVNILGPKDDLSLLNSDDFEKQYSIDVGRWVKSTDCQFQIYQPDHILNLLTKIKQHSAYARQYLDVMQGIVPYSKENHSKEIIAKRQFHSTQKISDIYGLWIKGRNIGRYTLVISNKEYLKYGCWLHRPRKPKYFQGERILIQEITGGEPPRIAATIYSKVLYHDPGIIACLNISQYNPEYILGIINSSLISWYHRVNSPKGKRKQFPKVLINDIRMLPIFRLNLTNKSHNKTYNKMVAYVRSMIDLYKKLEETKTPHQITILERQVLSTDRQIDQLVYELYGLTEEEIKIVEEAES